MKVYLSFVVEKFQRKIWGAGEMDQQLRMHNALPEQRTQGWFPNPVK